MLTFILGFFGISRKVASNFFDYRFISRVTWFYVLNGFLAVVFSFVTASVLKIIIDAVSQDNAVLWGFDFGSVLNLSLFLVATETIIGIFYYIANNFNNFVFTKAYHRSMKTVDKKLVHMIGYSEVTLMESNYAKKNISNLYQDIFDFLWIFLNSVPRRFTELLITIAFTVPSIFLVTNFWLVGIFFIKVLFILFFNSRLMNLRAMQVGANQAINERVWGIADNYTQNGKNILRAGLLGRAFDWFQMGRKEMEDNEVGFSRRRLILSNLSTIISSAIDMLLISWIVYMAVQGSITLGDLPFLVFIFRRADEMARGISEMFQLSEVAKVKFMRLEFFASKKPTLITSEKIHTVDNLKISKLTINNVGFKYQNYALAEALQIDMILKDAESKTFLGKLFPAPHSLNQLKKLQKEIEEIKKETFEEKYIYNNLSFSVESSKVYALVGKNGVGKTTMVNLLLKNLNPASGSIVAGCQNDKGEIEDIDYKNIDAVDLKNHLQAVFQVPFLLNFGTIRENVDPEGKKSDDEIWEYLRRVNLEERIRKSQRQLMSIPRDHLDLSGGEKQLLEIVRILSMSPEVMIFDEATNQLSPDNELLIFDQIKDQKQGKIIIFVTHRMTTARKADEIIVFSDQGIESRGGHHELLDEASGRFSHIYSDFWQKQVEN